MNLAFLLAAGFLVFLLQSTAQAQLSCEQTIGPRNSSLRLTRDLTCAGGSGDHALTLRGPIKLEMRGRTIRCTGSNKGIRLTGARAELVGPGSIINCDTGVTLSGDGSHRVRRVEIAPSNDSFTQGFNIFSSNNLIKLNVIKDVRDGIVIFTANGTKIRSNQIRRPEGSGIRPSLGASGSANVSTVIVGNIITSPGQLGIEVTQGGKVKNNRVVRSNGDGIVIRPEASNVRLIKNRVTDPADRGIVLSDQTEDNVVRRNTVSNSIIDGIVVEEGSLGNILLRNRALGSGGLDMVDDNPGCDQNLWADNVFDTSSRNCIR